VTLFIKSGFLLGTFKTPNIHYDRGTFHRHHLIPSEIIRRRSFLPFFLSLQCCGFDPQDFSTNGVLLPCTAMAAIEHRLPPHRGPHRHYNELVGERIAILIRNHCPNPFMPERQTDALAAIYLLQRGLRRGLVQRRPFIRLNRRDPMSRDVDFRDLDNEVGRLWVATEQSQNLPMS
jgi:A nuclease family of the HNH/ENDO VII superfamily with conserved AHH